MPGVPMWSNISTGINEQVWSSSDHFTSRNANLLNRLSGHTPTLSKFSSSRSVLALSRLTPAEWFNKQIQSSKKSDEIENSLLKDDDSSVEANKVSGIKRPQQTPTNNKGNLVYVRRKTESEHHKNSNCIKPNDQPIKPHEHDEKNHEQKNPINDSTISTHKDTKISSPSKGLSSIQQWEERYMRLQNFLKVLDLSNQDDYRQMLRSLTSVGLSRVAVELEKRSIQLSMEEAREVQRAKLVDTLHKFSTTTGEHPSNK
ncbi:unnamed protein product [Lactuca virosa]|uniref:Uncharacterized protein n=1 Tax=Lactuca virosa TaxID=75947 RepID=A0AAU9N5T6_9ASTR|nr:unnamed protein product [Lactuca virosa]